MLRRGFFKVPYKISGILLFTFIKVPAMLSLANLFLEGFLNLFFFFLTLRGAYYLRRVGAKSQKLTL